jgi:hypothetical protein
MYFLLHDVSMEAFEIAWQAINLETGEIRLRMRLYSDFGWRRIL